MTNYETIQYVHERLVRGDIKVLVNDVICELVQEANAAFLGLEDDMERLYALSLCEEVILAVRKESARRLNPDSEEFH